eukprot:1187138-Prorocentrum_minimum.AAC.2
MGSHTSVRASSNVSNAALLSSKDSTPFRPSTDDLKPLFFSPALAFTPLRSSRTFSRILSLRTGVAHNFEEGTKGSGEPDAIIALHPSGNAQLRRIVQYRARRPVTPSTRITHALPRVASACRKECARKETDGCLRMLHRPFTLLHFDCRHVIGIGGQSGFGFGSHLIEIWDSGLTVSTKNPKIRVPPALFLKSDLFYSDLLSTSTGFVAHKRSSPAGWELARHALHRTLQVNPIYTSFESRLRARQPLGATPGCRSVDILESGYLRGDSSSGSDSDSSADSDRRRRKTPEKEKKEDAVSEERRYAAAT